MTKTNISIKEVNEKKSSKTNKTFWSVIETNTKEFFSVWDKSIAEELIKNIGNTVSVEVAEKDNFKNITAFYEVISVEKPLLPTKLDIELMSRRKAVSIIMSYAKDIYIAEIEAKSKFCTDINSVLEMIKTSREEIPEIVKGLFEISENATLGEE